MTIGKLDDDVWKIKSGTHTIQDLMLSLEKKFCLT